MIYSSYEPDDQLGYFDNFFSECLERHFLLRGVKITRPPVPWMEDRFVLCNSNAIPQERKLPRIIAKIRDKLKAAVSEARENFTRHSLSTNKPKKV